MLDREHMRAVRKRAEEILGRPVGRCDVADVAAIAQALRELPVPLPPRVTGLVLILERDDLPNAIAHVDPEDLRILPPEAWGAAVLCALNELRKKAGLQ